MEVDRTTALCYFVRFLAGNPDGDAATRALVLGALAPVGGVAASIYAHDREATLRAGGKLRLRRPDDERLPGRAAEHADAAVRGLRLTQRRSSSQPVI